jgi:phosphoribosylformylglycinamidine synthase I
MLPKVLILYANGTNRELEAAYAFELAGAIPEIAHINQLRAGKKRLEDYQILAIPGGFSYADTLGAGHLFALELNHYFTEELQLFIEAGKPVIGICNGFQALVKSGLLPQLPQKPLNATLTFNANGKFECRWVNLRPQSEKCLWTRNLTDLIYCPVAHGEGRFLLENPDDLKQLILEDQIALSYVYADGKPAVDDYPYNPNGSIAGIAGICNAAGNVLGLMPHPEDHVQPFQHPRWTRGDQGQLGISLFKNGVDYVR